LEIFATAYDIDRLAESLLPAGFAGIALSKIQHALKDRGLRAEPRQNFTIRELKTALRTGWIAIIPVEGNETCHDYDFSGKPTAWNHYVVAVHHPEQGPVLVDVLRSIVPLDRSPLKDEHLRDPKRAVLFVRR
jgi:hypothetical protein